MREADIDDGYAPGVSTAESQRIKEFEPVGERIAESASATSKSAVSRKFVAMTETELAELLSGDLSGLDLVALMIDRALRRVLLCGGTGHRHGRGQAPAGAGGGLDRQRNPGHRAAGRSA